MTKNANENTMIFKNKKIDKNLISEYKDLLEWNMLNYFYNKFFGYKISKFKGNLFIPELNQIILLRYGKQNKNDIKKARSIFKRYQKPVLIIFFNKKEIKETMVGV